MQKVSGERWRGRNPRLSGGNGRAYDKGLLITTGTFTPDAKREATRDGAPAIDLIDGDDLIPVNAPLQGLRPAPTYRVLDLEPGSAAGSAVLAGRRWFRLGGANRQHE